LVETEMVPVVGDDIAGRKASDDLEGILQAVEALADRREFDPELVVLGLEPRGTYRQLQATVAGVVDGDGLRGQDRGVSVRHPGDEQAQSYARCRRRQGSESRHAFKALTGAFAVHRDEVVKAPGAVEAQLLSVPHTIDDIVKSHPLLGNIDSKAHVAES
jgi:hypothetical protein